MKPKRTNKKAGKAMERMVERNKQNKKRKRARIEEEQGIKEEGDGGEKGW